MMFEAKGAPAKKRVYVAGPYSRGDIARNVRAAVVAADRLFVLGFAPFVPHLTHFWHLLCPHDYEQWLALDFEWLRACDAVLRLPGESSGADRETALAGELGVPVYYSERLLLEGLAKKFVEAPRLPGEG